MSWINDFAEYVFPVDATTLQMEAGFELKTSHLPERLFKYREFNSNSLKNLQDDTVWLADPETFNDPYDCHHFIDYNVVLNGSLRTIDAAIREILPKKNSTKIEELLATAENPTDVLIDAICENEDADTRESIKAAMHARHLKQFEDLAKHGDKMKAGFRLCSFSERVDSTLMWAHYASNHRGFCVEYGIRSLPPKDFASRFMFPVVYQDEVFDATECMLSVNTPRFNALHLNRAALIKGTDWSYEKEWRLVFSNGFLEKSQAWKMPTPKAVYLGSHISAPDEGVLKEICALKGIPMFKMEHSRSHFSMAPRAL